MFGLAQRHRFIDPNEKKGVAGRLSRGATHLHRALPESRQAMRGGSDETGNPGSRSRRQRLLPGTSPS